MEDYLFSESEEATVDTVKNAFYDANFSLETVKELTNGLPAEREKMVLQAAFEEVSAEQAQRRRYIVLTLFPNNELDPTRHETLAAQLFDHFSNNQLGILSQKLGVNLIQVNIAQDIIEQAKIYGTTDKNMTDFASQLILAQKIKPLLPLLDTLSSEELRTLLKAIDAYISQVSVGREENPLYNPGLPSSITDTLARARMSLTLNKLTDMGSRIEFLVGVMTISQALIDNRDNKTFADNGQLSLAIARLMFAQDTSFEYVV